jgi:hypothetical protein
MKKEPVFVLFCEIFKICKRTSGLGFSNKFKRTVGFMKEPRVQGRFFDPVIF